MGLLRSFPDNTTIPDLVVIQLADINLRHATVEHQQQVELQFRLSKGKDLFGLFHRIGMRCLCPFLDGQVVDIARQILDSFEPPAIPEECSSTTSLPAAVRRLILFLPI